MPQVLMHRGCRRASKFACSSLHTENNYKEKYPIDAIEDLPLWSKVALPWTYAIVNCREKVLIRHLKKRGLQKLSTMENRGCQFGSKTTVLFGGFISC